MARATVRILAGLVILASGACDAEPDTSGADAAVTLDAGALDPSRLVPGCFRGGEEPQLDLSGPLESWAWNDPHVLRVGDAYWMVASAAPAFEFPVRLYRLTSEDGITWASDPMLVLDAGAAGSWDAGGVETPALVFFRGQYHLFYTGYDRLVGDPMHDPGDFRIGHAVSSDGVAFTRSSEAPILGPSSGADPSDDWYRYVVGEPGPVVVGDTLRVYFTAVGAHPTLGVLQVIGMTSSSDGVSWSAPQLVLEPDQALYPRSDAWVGYSTPNAIVLADGVHLFFDVATQPEGGAWRQVRLHHARSADGLSGWAHDGSAIRATTDFAWTRDEIRSPAALVDGATLRLYFAGHELDGVAPDHFAVGMLTCPL